MVYGKEKLKELEKEVINCNGYNRENDIQVGTNFFIVDRMTLYCGTEGVLW